MSNTKVIFIKHSDGQIYEREFQPSDEITTAKEFAAQFDAIVVKKSEYDAYQNQLTKQSEQDSLEKQHQFERKQAKMKGFDYQDTMCSATREDQNGLVAVLLDFQSDPTNFKPTLFKFDNGNEIVLNKENLMDFKTKWTEFRRSFYEVKK